MRERDCFDELLKNQKKKGRKKRKKKKKKKKFVRDQHFLGNFIFGSVLLRSVCCTTVLQTSSRKKNIFFKNSFTLLRLKLFILYVHAAPPQTKMTGGQSVYLYLFVPFKSSKACTVKTRFDLLFIHTSHTYQDHALTFSRFTFNAAPRIVLITYLPDSSSYCIISPRAPLCCSDDKPCNVTRVPIGSSTFAGNRPIACPFDNCTAYLPESSCHPVIVPR